MQFQAYFNHSLLKPSVTKRDLKQLCDDAIQYKFYSVCVNSYNVRAAKSFLLKNDVKISATVGFPFGVLCSRTQASFEFLI